MNLVIHHLAVQMPSARRETEQDRVVVYQNTSEILTLVVDLNVYRTLIAIVQKLVSTISAKTHVQEFVESMRSVAFKTMLQFAFV